MTYRIMIVEDEEKIRETVKAYLEQAGYAVRAYAGGLDALGDFGAFKPHLVVLDISMPGISGWDVLKEVRAVSKIPVLMLTALNTEPDRLKGFEHGADDYIGKPFSPRELVSRVNVFIRRVYGGADRVLTYDDLALNTEQKTLSKNGENIPITTREYDLLALFFENIGYPLTREQIIQRAIGFEYEGFDRSIDAFIKNIRKKIEDDLKNPKYIRTKYGYGYVFGGGDEH